MWGRVRTEKHKAHNISSANALLSGEALSGVTSDARTTRI